MTLFVTRSYSQADVQAMVQLGLHPVLARLYASRGLRQTGASSMGLTDLLAPNTLKGAAEAAVFLADAIMQSKRLLIIADYDCDGATACAVALRGLRSMGAQVDYLVPNRFEYGYGLTPEIVALAAQRRPDVLITVDNGIASIDGVRAAQACGIDVVITDHHLPGAELPEASAIVNPNQPGCTFTSKHLAGVGVMFYVLLSLRAELRQRGFFRGLFDKKTQPPLKQLLDLVALGTVADLVKLDSNNRILVAQGLAQIRTGHLQAGLAALFTISGRNARHATTVDLGFSLGPRINAAGRLADMSLGIECLITDDLEHGLALANTLDEMNRQRRVIEAEIQASALIDLSEFEPHQAMTLSVYQEEWHQGVIGIVAARLKEKFHRPTFVFALAGEEKGCAIAKGSGRSISGFHLQDALDLISKRYPDLILKFGGHAMAAGLTIRAHDIERFRGAFEEAGRELLSAALLTRTIETDGELEHSYFTSPFITLLEQQIWGQGFPAPLFSGEFMVRSQTLLKEKHMRLDLMRDGKRYQAIFFNHATPLPQHIFAAYRLSNNVYNGMTRVQLLIEHIV